MQGETSNFWKENIKFGNLTIPRFMSAPIDGIIDSPFRRLIRKFSPKVLVFTEMRHVACIANEKDEKSLKYNPTEHPICFQISANDIQFIDTAIHKILEKKIDAINLNIGCPAKNIVKSGCGSALMADLPRLKKIIKQLKKSIGEKVSLNVKIRAGFKEKNALEVSQLAVDEGASAIIIHPRTQPEGFAAPLDFELVRKIKETVNVPIIFSGNINNFERAKKAYELTGVDGFMIGRALYGCPWKIKKIMENAIGNNFEISQEDSIKTAIEHLNLAANFYGPKYGFHIIKQHLPQYIKRIENAGQVRKQLMASITEEEMRKTLNSLLSKNK